MNEFEIYVHIPFCLQKCRYCDFLSFRCREDVKEAYVEALKKEALYRSGAFSGSRAVSVFFGGGTPTVLPAKTLCSLADDLRRSYDFSDDCEITTECNPATADKEYFRGLLHAGFNRVSIGVQSFDDGCLERLGRIHSSDDAKRAIDSAHDAGFENVNVDLMSAIPGQKLKMWIRDLDTAVSFGATHISAYSLILEEGTYLYDHRSELDLPGEEEERRMYDMTFDILSRKGFHQYEISNYAKEGFDCRHNTGYWTGVPYIGLGLGASSYLDRKRSENEKDINRYISLLGEGASVTHVTEELKTEDLMSEFMILGLRMTSGVSVSEFKERFGEDLFEIYGETIEKYTDSGFLERDGDRIRFSRKGISVSNTILADLI